MITITKKVYDIYLSNLIYAAVKEVEKDMRPVIIPVHTETDLVKINLMLNELLFQYPESININAQLLKIH